MKNLVIDGKEVIFLRQDGSECTNTVGIGGKGEDGECLFYEIIDKIDDPKIKGQLKYKRLLIQQVYPAIKMS